MQRLLFSSLLPCLPALTLATLPLAATAAGPAAAVTAAPTSATNVTNATSSATKSATAAEAPPIRTRAYSTAQLLFALRTDTQTLARLTPVADPSFDFTPGPREGERQFDGYRHIGDLGIKLRVGDGPWRHYTSYDARQPIRLLATGKALAAADISRSISAAGDPVPASAAAAATTDTRPGNGASDNTARSAARAALPITVERRWLNERGALVLRFTLINRGKQPVEIAELGLPMVFDQDSANRTREEALASASMVRPRPGDQGLVEVVRLNGQPPALRVLPDGATPLTAWQPPAATSQVGMREDYADWVTGGFTLKPGARREIGLRFVIRAQGATR